MVSLRFPFLFSQPPKPPISGRGNVGSRPFSASAIACSVAAAATAAGATFAVSQSNPSNPFLQNALSFLLSNFSPSNGASPFWCSLSLTADPPPATEPKTGVSFPSVLGDSRQLLGMGVRRKSVFGLKNIDVYAFGVYADEGDRKKLLSENYGKVSDSELKERRELVSDLMESDIRMTVRLQIVYGRLSIRSVRSAFEESVGSRLQKFGGSDNNELLQRFTSQFKDEYKIPRGSIIDLSREQGQVLHTRIDGKEVGSVQSKILCRSILDLYVGDDPFDRKAREDVAVKLAALVQK
ncbi:Chalcone isomerase [Bertholletia excelsa]